MSHELSTTEAILLDIQKTFGGLQPNIFKTYAKNPALLSTNWEKYKAIMLQGKLQRKVKEIIAVLVSRDNQCDYCIAAHCAALHSLDLNAAEINALLQNNLPDSLTDQEKALIEFACKANLDWHAIDSTDRQQLLELGISESELLEALGTMELFITYNRFADVMAGEIDF